ncbi:MAG: patatin-like phospholipase family protein, partial [Chloroflexi bacterium]|nr:patatin-like phospholipase family protein [Chloroflexota bacterium]
MTTRALVLGGGGPVGIAWEAGIIKGLLDGGVDATEADLIVGTSAGSVVGTQIASGRSPQDLLAAQAAPSEGAAGGRAGVDVGALRELFQKWAGATELTEALRAEIGALAPAAR